MDLHPDLKQLNEDQLRHLAATMLAQFSDNESAHESRLAERDETIRQYRIRNEQLTHELALFKRHQFGKRSEAGSPQMRLLDDLVNEDIVAVETELEQLAKTLDDTLPKKRTPKRKALPAELPRTEIQHDPESTQCACGCTLSRIGEDISEKLDYTPGTFRVERHIRSKWACKDCETIVQAPVAPHVIDKGIPTTNLLAQVLIAKYADHQPLYRQEQIYARAGVGLPRSTLAAWVGRCGVELAPLVEQLRQCLLKEPVLHADETPVPMLSPGKKRTHRAYIWAYSTPKNADTQAVVYDFRPGRAGEASREFLAEWRGQLVCDDYSGYKAGFATGITEVGCWAHARRKFFELTERNDSPIAKQALGYIGALYDIERQGATLSPEQRQQLRDTKARPIAENVHDWLTHQRTQLTNGTRTAKAIDYALKRWAALTRYLDDGAVPIDNNWVENQIRPWALGRKNWLFAGSQRSGERAANVMTLIQSAKINGLDPQAYLRDVLERMPTAKQSDLYDLLPHNWKAPVKV
jgi:transposase